MTALSPPRFWMALAALSLAGNMALGVVLWRHAEFPKVCIGDFPQASVPSSGRDGADSPAAIVMKDAAAARDQEPGTREAVDEAMKTLQAARDELRKSKTVEVELRGQVADLQQQLQAAGAGGATADKAESPRASAPAAAPAPATFRFGLPETTPVFDAADWPDLSTHMHALAGVLPELLADLKDRGQPSDGVIGKLQEHNLPLAGFAIQAAGEIPGTGPNGAYTHPAVIANLVRGVLLGAGDPLAAEQEIAIGALGEAWTADEAWRTANTPEDALLLLRTVEEVDAKLRFLRSLKTLLTDSQRALLFNPQTEGRAGLDLLSPGLVYLVRLPQYAADREALERKVVESLLLTAGLKDVDPAQFAWVGRNWIDSLPFAQAAAPAADATMDAMFPPVERVQAAARAEAAAIEQILATGWIEDPKAKALRLVTTVLIPGLKPEAAAKDAPKGQ